MWNIPVTFACILSCAFCCDPDISSAAGHLGKDYSEGVDVAPEIGWQAADLFRRGIDCGTCIAFENEMRIGVRKGKVNQLHIQTVFCDKNVRGLQIPVQHLFEMDEAYCVKNLGGNPVTKFVIAFAQRKHFFKCAPVNPFHLNAFADFRNCSQTVVFPDVGMIETAPDLKFLLEDFAVEGIVPKFVPDGFQDHDSASLRVLVEQKRTAPLRVHHLHPDRSLLEGIASVRIKES